MSPVSRCKSVLVITAASLVMAACGGAGGSSDDAAGEPVSGGTVSFIQMSEPRILDPGVMTNGLATNVLVGNGLFGTLLIDKPDGGFEYSLAEGMETSDGGTTWKLTLRDGITFSDGSPMDAADVAYNWERLKDPQLGSTSKTTADYLDELKPDGQVLTFTLTEPIANFANGIAYYSLNWIAKPEALEAGQAEFDKDPVGAGPFVLESWTRGGKMVLKKNPEYFEEGKPYLDELVLTANPDEGQRLQTVLSGGADLAVTNDRARYEEGVEGGLKGLTQGLNGGIAFGMNFARPPFDDPRAREAVVKAVDPEAINAAAYEGKAEVPKTLFDEDSPFYTDTPFTALDPDRAQELFDELAAEGKPLEFTYTMYQAPQAKRVAESVQAQLAAYDNVKVKVELLDFPSATATLNSREFQMAPALSANFIDPEMSLYQILHTGSPGNQIGLSDKQMDEALELGRTSSDPEERKAAYKTVAERINATYPAVYYTRFVQGATYQPYLGGLEQYSSGSIPVDRIWTTK